MSRSKTITVNPSETTAFITNIYEQQEQLCSNALPLTVDEYVRMIKTIILKRVQDIHEKCFPTS